MPYGEIVRGKYGSLSRINSVEASKSVAAVAVGYVG
jgi:hypothetical protein